MKLVFAIAVVLAALGTCTSALAGGSRTAVRPHPRTGVQASNPFMHVTDDPAVIRRHRAIGRLPLVVPPVTAHSAPGVRTAGEFDWGDAALGFGAGMGAAGIAVAFRSRLARRPAAA